MKHQIIEMLEMQDAMNIEIHEDWRAQHHSWPRAIWVEAGELLTHYGYKWWKKQEPNPGQAQLELVDIWHFVLSNMLQTGTRHDLLADSIEAAFSCDEAAYADAQDFSEVLEAYVIDVLHRGDYGLRGFPELMRHCHLTFDGLYRLYVGKNTLNRFRQHKGYNDGSYHKQWGGREDNEHLSEILASMDTNADDFSGDVYATLEGRYKYLVTGFEL